MTPRRPGPTDFAGRDLRFHPAVPAAATTCTPAQVERYNAEGFLTGLDVFAADEAARWRSYVDDLLAVVTAHAGRDSYAVNGFHTTCAGLWDLATEPRILALVRDVLGPQIVCWGTHLFAKLPGDGREVPFHQDAVYWPFTPTRTTTVWLAIDDVDHGNAPVEFVPTSHLVGPLPHEDLAPDGTRVLPRRALGMDAWPDRVPDVLAAGQVSLHSDLLLHGSAANTSARRRAGLTLRYAAADVGVLPGFGEWQAAAVHVLDGDPSGRWPHCPRPPGDDPERALAATAADAG